MLLAVFGPEYMGVVFAVAGLSGCTGGRESQEGAVRS